MPLSTHHTHLMICSGLRCLHAMRNTDPLRRVRSLTDLAATAIQLTCSLNLAPCCCAVYWTARPLLNERDNSKTSSDRTLIAQGGSRAPGAPPMPHPPPAQINSSSLNLSKISFFLHVKFFEVQIGPSYWGSFLVATLDHILCKTR